MRRIDKKGKEITKSISYRLQFIDIERFMATSLSNFVNNLAEKIHKIKFKYRHFDKKCESCGINVCGNKVCESFLECTNFKNVLIENKCF